MKSKTLNDLETYLHHTAIDMLLKAYRDLALEEHSNRDRDRYSYFNTEMRGLDTVAKRLGLTDIEPRETGYFYDDEEKAGSDEVLAKIREFVVGKVEHSVSTTQDAWRHEVNDLLPLYLLFQILDRWGK